MKIFYLIIFISMVSCNNDSSITEPSEFVSDKITLLTPIKECFEFKIKYKVVDISKKYRWAFVDDDTQFFINHNPEDSIINGVIPYGMNSFTLTLLYKSSNKQYDSIGYAVRIPFQFITSNRTGLTSIKYNIDSIPNLRYDSSNLSRISNIDTYNFSEYDTTKSSLNFVNDTINFGIRVFKRITFEGNDSESQLQIVIKDDLKLTKLIHKRFEWLVSDYTESMNDGVFLYNIKDNVIYGRIYPHFTRTTYLPLSLFIKIKFK